jgi:hypothetical protein
MVLKKLPGFIVIFTGVYGSIYQIYLLFNTGNTKFQIIMLCIKYIEPFTRYT